MLNIVAMVHVSFRCPSNVRMLVSTVCRCAEFFMQHGHQDKAVKMLIAAGQYGRALELCVEHDVTITEVRAWWHNNLTFSCSAKHMQHSWPY